MTVTQKINVRADELADKALIEAITHNKFIKSVFPMESIAIQIASGCVASSPNDAISELWGEQVAMELFNRRGVVSKELFPFIYWEGMPKVMRSFPPMFVHG
jgi:hypothetical protein